MQRLVNRDARITYLPWPFHYKGQIHTRRTCSTSVPENDLKLANEYTNALSVKQNKSFQCDSHSLVQFSAVCSLSRFENV